MSQAQIVYPAGAKVRVGEICRTPARRAKDGSVIEPERPGLLPINRATWYKWLKQGRVPPGQKIGGNTTVWTVAQVLALGRPMEGEHASPAEGGAVQGAAAAAGTAGGRRGPKRGPVAAAAAGAAS